MHNLIFASILFFLVSCSEKKHEHSEVNLPPEPITVATSDYELFIPKQQDGLLILFPCFPCNAANTRTEFDIVDLAMANNISVLLMNFNQRLWLSENENRDLEKILLEAVSQNSISTDNTYMGGFSGGGNVSLLLTDYLKSKDSPIQMKGVFIVDSPVDLLELYENAQRTIKKNFSAVALQEANMLVERFDSEFGLGDTALVNFTKRSPYLSRTHSTHNLSNLDQVEVRLYSEPDTAWWRINRQATYDEMNASYIEKLARDLGKMYGEDKVSYIKTKNRGYRANGNRHPHSWAIVDEMDLVNWILSK